MRERCTTTRSPGLCQVLLPLLALLWAGAAEARPTPKTLREAKVAIENGTDHFRAAQYEKAVTEFRKALAVLREPGLIWNIARAYEELGDVRNASHYFKDLVKRYPKDASVKEAKKRIKALAPRMPGTLSLDCGDESGAQVVVDGAPGKRCDQQLGLLSPGMHTLKVSSGEHGVWRKRVRIQANQKLKLVVDWKQASEEATGAQSDASEAASEESDYEEFDPYAVFDEGEGGAAKAASAPAPQSGAGSLPMMVAGGGGLLLLGAGVFGALSASAVSDYEALKETDQTSLTQMQSEADRANGYASLALALGVGGLGALAAGVYMLASGGDGGSEQASASASVSVALAPTGGVLVLTGGRF